uniref:hypothetical protein n=1 Tax=Xanthomonas graminis TaxID=3390026 RepID=UPI00396478BC
MAKAIGTHVQGRVLTGAWIETGTAKIDPLIALVASSRARGLKLRLALVDALLGESRPHGRVD